VYENIRVGLYDDTQIAGKSWKIQKKKAMLSDETQIADSNWGTIKAQAMKGKEEYKKNAWYRNFV
jgi:hypothetical protein